MFPSLPSSNDMLAQFGVINYDADSYIKGEPPRYAGSSDFHLPGDMPLPGFVPTIPGGTPKINQQPQKDEFVPSSMKNIPWKTALAITAAAALAIFAGVKFKAGKKAAAQATDGILKTIAKPFKAVGAWFKSIFSKTKSKLSKDSSKSTSNWFKSTFKSASDWIKKTFDKIKSKFTKKP